MSDTPAEPLPQPVPLEQQSMPGQAYPDPAYAPNPEPPEEPS
jgi:hypothetical protein